NEAEVSALRSLLLDRLIATALALLHAEVHVSGRGVQYDAEPQVEFHRGLPSSAQLPIACRYRSADRFTADFPSRSITMSQNATSTRSNSNGSTALTIRSIAEAPSGM